MEGEVGYEGQRRRPVGQDELWVNLQDAVNGERQASNQRDLTARKPQYSRLISTSMGAPATLRAFLRRKRAGLLMRSASRPAANVAVARERPMMVKYCMCHPYEALLEENVHQPRYAALMRWEAYMGLGFCTR